MSKDNTLTTNLANGASTSMTSNAAGNASITFNDPNNPANNTSLSSAPNVPQPLPGAQLVGSSTSTTADVGEINPLGQSTDPNDLDSSGGWDLTH